GRERDSGPDDLSVSVEDAGDGVGIDGLVAVGLQDDVAGDGNVDASVAADAPQRHEDREFAAYRCPPVAGAFECDAAAGGAGQGQRHDDAAAGCELVEPGGGDFPGADGGDDPVVGGVGWIAEGAVADDGLDIDGVRVGEVATGSVDEVVVDVDGGDVAIG